MISQFAILRRVYYSDIFICNAKWYKIVNQVKTPTCKCLVRENFLKKNVFFFINFLLSVSPPNLLCMVYPLDAQAVTSKTRASQLTTAVRVVAS